LKCEPADKLYFSTTTGEKVILKLTNTESKNVAYKLKTTAPKSYGLRPKEGLLTPGQTEEVAIVLVKNGIDGANNQRFQLTAMVTSSSEILTKEQWEDGKDGGKIQESRLAAFLEGESENLKAPINKAFVSGKALGEIPPSIPEHPAPSASPTQAKHDSLTRHVHGLEGEKQKAEKDKKLYQGMTGDLKPMATPAEDLASLANDPALRPVASLTLVALLLSILARRRNGTSSWRKFFRDLLLTGVVVGAYGAGRHGGKKA